LGVGIIGEMWIRRGFEREDSKLLRRVWGLVAWRLQTLEILRV